MEEIIKEIEKAESDAAALKAEADKKAAEIISELDHELKSLKESYEQRLRDDSVLILAETKKKINTLAVQEEKNHAEVAKQIESGANNRIEPCVDYVYDFLMKGIK